MQNVAIIMTLLIVPYWLLMLGTRSRRQHSPFTLPFTAVELGEDAESDAASE
jgi:hypothetical protein